MSQQQRVRTTISIDPEALAVYQRMAEASGESVSRCMGDWLAETAEGAQMVGRAMVQAKLAPRRVMREFHQVMAGVLAEDITGRSAEHRAEVVGLAAVGGGRRGGAGGDGTPGATRSPPSSPTGVKDSPKTRAGR